MNNIIGISGKAGSGKDTLAKILRSQLGSDWEIRSFAHKMKTTLEYHFPDHFSKELWENSRNYRNIPVPGCNKTKRDLLIEFGEAVKVIDEEYWAKALFSDYTDESKWIITDCRAMEEFKYLQRYKAILVKVETPSNEEEEFDIDKFKDYHYTILNDSSKNDLFVKSRKMLDEFSSKGWIKCGGGA